MANEKDALPAPVPGGPQPDSPAITITPSVAETTGGDDQASLDNSFNRTVRHLASQKEVEIRITKEQGPTFVKINGWSAWYQPGRHMVPEQVAEILREADRI